MTTAGDPVDTPYPLGQRSLPYTLKAMLHGHEVLVTLRGVDFASVKVQVEEASTWLQAQAPPPPAVPQGQGAGWCPTHQCPMTWNAGKEGRQGWYSHRTAEGWCKGRR